ncbi:WD domain-containing protein [Xylariomycetidae sp. FL0641]|nr:WD domain-containing protein [Xylariomycetidae sp. FL0641]
MYNQGKIMRRLLGRSETQASADANLGVTSSPLAQSYRPNASQNAVYSSSLPVACLDRSSDGRIAVLGGRHILKTIHIDGSNIREGVDVRSVITAQYTGKSNAASSVSDQLSIKDVKIAWNNGIEPTIFTACANGKIFMYDVNRLSSGMGLEFIQVAEGSRQVNKLDFSPHRQTLMLSGGQDGVVRCFDMKAPVDGRNGPTFRPFQAFRTNADGVRDVKWAPTDGFIFACATESGVIMKWDFRKATAPYLKINAHDTQKGVSSISWHPDGDHLLSSGLDGACHVWDFSKQAERRQRPMWTINAPAPVTSASWRPGLWSATAQGRRAAQIAVSYDEGGNLKKNGISSVHIWDFARPTMPYKEIDLFEHSPNALLWHDQDLLWTAGPDGFMQCDVAFAPKVMDRQPLSSLKFSSQGDVLMFLEQRAQVTRPRPTSMAQQVPHNSPYSSSPTGQMLSISRSDSEEDVVGSFLGPKRRTNHRRRISNRPGQGFSTTPPSNSALEDRVIPLEQAVGLTNPFRPQQVMAIGHVPAGSKVHLQRHLAPQYFEILEQCLPVVASPDPLNDRVIRVLEHFARASERMAQFRLAQTWRILSYAMSMLLTRRSQYHLERRLTRNTRKSSPPFKRSDSSLMLQPTKDMSQGGLDNGKLLRKPPSISSSDSRQTARKSLLAHEIDSGSNASTPQARPVRDDVPEARRLLNTKQLTPVEEVESLSLPPTLQSEIGSLRKRHDSTPMSVMSEESQVSLTEGYDFYDVEAIEALPKAIDVPKKREPLKLDYVDPGASNSRRKPAERHDSDESFGQMFSLSDAGSRQASVLTSSSASSMHPTSYKVQRNGESTDNIELEYGSRIRGKEIPPESPEKAGCPIRRLSGRQDSGGLSDDFMVSQTTTETFDSDPSFAEEQMLPYSPEINVPNYLGNNIQPHAEIERYEDNTAPTITETDYLPWENDPPYPHPITSEKDSNRKLAPIDPYDIVTKAVAFESRHSVLNASAIILLLKPLMPSEVIDTYQASAILRHEHSRLMGMQLFAEAALLRNLCVRGWPEGLETWGDHYPAIFRQAQERVTVGYACAQCHRPREVDRSSPDSTGIWRCERCRATVAPCAVCGHREAEADYRPPEPVREALSKGPTQQSEEPLLSTWWYCPGCSHGGHAGCLQEWHAPITPPPPPPRDSPGSSSNVSEVDWVTDTSFPPTESDGCCPLDGCGHACLPGRWRDELAVARTEELGRTVREQVNARPATASAAHSQGLPTMRQQVGARRKRHSSADRLPLLAGADVPQSRAVESVRETLGIIGGVAGPGILSTSPGDRERRKSVKFAGPEDLEQEEGAEGAGRGKGRERERANDADERDAEFRR